MKAIIYLATSLNGKIARDDHTTGWCDAEWAKFSEKVIEVGNLVIGRKTFEVMAKEGEFQILGNPLVIVVSQNTNLSVPEGVLVCETPELAIDCLKERGFQSALLAGGAQLAESCLNNGLVSELYLDVEPILFKEGILLFPNLNKEINLQLINSSHYGDDSVQLHYLVKGK